MPRLPLFVAALLAAPLLARADRIYLKHSPNKPDDGGTVLREERGCYVVQYGELGVIWIPKERVERVEKTTEQDTAAHGAAQDLLKLGDQNMERGNLDLALDLYLKAHAEGYDAADYYRKIAKVYEAKKWWRHAVQACEDYLKKSPADAAAVRSIVEGLRRKPQNPEEPALDAAPKAAPPGAAPSAREGPPPTRRAEDGLEGAPAWNFESWPGEFGTYPVNVKVAERNQEGTADKMLEIWFQPDARDPGKIKFAFSRGLPAGALAGKKALEFDAYLDGDLALDLALALDTQLANGYFESQTQPVTPKAWKRISFDLTANRFKSAATGFKQYSSEIAGLDRVKKLLVIGYPAPNARGYLVLNNVAAK